MDLHSKMIIGYSFSKKMDTDLALRTLDQAISNQMINGQLVLHTNQGTQYTSKSYQNRLTELDIQHSFSRKGCPYDNAGIEFFHATLKKNSFINAQPISLLSQQKLAYLTMSFAFTIVNEFTLVLII